MRGRRRNRILGVVAALMLCAPVAAESQFVAQTGCGQVVLAACATIHTIDFTGTILTMVIENTSTTASYVDRVFMAFEPQFEFPSNFETLVTFGIWNDVSQAFVGAGPTLTDTWDVQPRNGSGPLGVAWDARLTPEGDEDLQMGVAALFQIDFTPIDMEQFQLADWTAEMKGIDNSYHPQGSDFTVVQGSNPPTVAPEPSTVLLLATGLALVAFVSRRRRTVTEA